ncbi:MAG: hypothetical protein PHU53_05660 [Thermoplasmata archaeon]|nr:hypothetical protein [Thermoplasmata archaeon]
MRRTDVIYYGGYLALFILFGVWMLVWALNMAGIGQAFLLWLLSAGIILMVVGVINASGPTASNLQLAGGMGLSAFMLIMLALSGDIIGGAVGASVGIILIGIIGLVLLFRRIKLEE